MTFGSLFAGVGGLDLGLERAGMRCAWQVEIDPQARSVLRRHWPDVDLHEDVRSVGSANLARVDLIVGGFPCQDVSVAGRRAGLAGERSGLFYEFMRVVAEFAPRWLLIENVPGLLSSNGGRDMGAVLGTLGQLGYGYAWRVLDAQHFGVPQRRRRVFIVGHSGGVCPPEVLFEPESVSWDTQAREAARQGVAEGALAGTLDARTTAGGLPGTDGAASGHVVAGQCHGGSVGELGTLRAGNGGTTGGVPFVAHTLRAEGFDASEDGTGRGTPIVAHVPDVSPALKARDYKGPSSDGDGDGAPLVVVPFDTTQVTSPTNRSRAEPGAPCHSLSAAGHAPAVAFNWQSGGDCRGLNAAERTSALHAGQVPAVAFSSKDHGADAGQFAPTLRAMPHDASHPNGGRQVVVFQSSQSGVRQVEAHATLDSNNGSRRHNGMVQHAIPRRLTPRECERLMGWPDDHTRYGTAVPLMRWTPTRPLPGRTMHGLWTCRRCKHYEREHHGYVARRDCPVCVRDRSLWQGVELADGPRYRMCGNAVVPQVAEFIGRRILDAHRRTA